MPFGRFTIFNVAGAAVWAALYGLAAYQFGKEVEQVGPRIALAFGVIAVAIVVVTVTVIRRHERRLEAMAEQAYPGPLEGYPGGPPL
jgi:membrane protein DedA with SNARE-associated domain